MPAKKLNNFVASLFLLTTALASHSTLAKAGEAEKHHNSRSSSCCHPSSGPTAPGVSSIVIQADSGHVLEQKGADISRYPASLTKLMTLDLAFRALHDGRIKLDTRLPVSKHAAGVAPVKLYLRPGDTLSVHQAILAMTTMSANDAATALGEYLGHGSESRFARMMTERAHALGMKQTEFRNASGLPNAAQVTTARDLSILTRDLVLNYPEYQHFFQRTNFVFRNRVIYSNNQMLRLYAGTIGMKTGYTDLARHNLITAAKRHDKILIGVVLHEPSWGDSYNQMTAMLDDGFEDSSVLVAATHAKPGGEDAGSLLFPSADAATIPPAVQHAKLHERVNAHTQNQPAPPLWAAQVGSYSHYAAAREQAQNIRHLRGVGTAQVLKFHAAGKVVWAARVTGLTKASAHKTCSILATRNLSCLVIAER